MQRDQVNWQEHIKKYEASGMTMKQYCADAGIGFLAFRRQRYRKSVTPKAKAASFKEYSVGVELSVSIAEDGSLSLKGLSPDQIPSILRACRAVQEEA